MLREAQAQSAEAVRLQLEGRAEVLEGALAREALLEGVLRGGRWKSRLRAHPELVAERARSAPEVAEALERTRRRAESEGWPGETRILVVVRELLDRRARLEALVRRRLASLAPVSGAPVLDEELARLDGLVCRQSSFALAEREVVVYETLPLRAWPPVHWALVALLACLAHGLFVLFTLRAAPGTGSPDVLSAGLFLGLSGTFVALVSRSGQVRLTSERLIWKPRVGETVELSLSSLRPESLHLTSLLRTVRVEGERRLRLRHQGDGERVITLVALHGLPPLAGAARAGVLTEDVVIYPAESREGRHTYAGHAVLRPSGVWFVPEVDGRQVFEAVTGQKASVPMRPLWILEQLRWLSPAEVDRCMARVVAAAGGTWWSAKDARLHRDVPVWRRLRITRGTQTLTGKVEWFSQTRAGYILRAWPAAPDSGEGGPPRGT
ncbi:hypothetical protein LZ198_36485 [Myxococcus sp. K15C18031901]|uniref:hypothetical protein n=1 Tax=Myxococcus dinghuensis TaxID=2906761 RepID=UPI0020A83773|nr:hypothetical protein [Myxococcus dinghuensis]MCP3104376.1 hypothetical protein [Myxococcus dinghuensis]